ncbi:STAS domain-containing protein [Fontimonas sp. SYSU GA230001]|uniref:STAS domain-containing protein n=1 Tax=Fontimonas sp. SYSU GA230001 TaxID=3142450 RepID=UPI0032B40B5C
MGTSSKAGSRKSRHNPTIRLAAELGMDGMRDLHAQLLGCWESAGTVTLEAAEVQRVHGAALQLFCSFFRDRGRAGRETRWHQPTDALRSAAALLGLTELIQLA